MGGSGLTTQSFPTRRSSDLSQPRLERVLNNGANAVLTSVSSFFIDGESHNNQPGTVLDRQANVAIFDSVPGTFSNAGTFRKSAGTGTSTISLPFNNTSTVEV